MKPIAMQGTGGRKTLAIRPRISLVLIVLYLPFSMVSCLAQQNVVSSLTNNKSEDSLSDSVITFARLNHQSILADVTGLTEITASSTPTSPKLDSHLPEQRLSNGIILYWPEPRLSTTVKHLLEDSEGAPRRFPDNYPTIRLTPRPERDSKTGKPKRKASEPDAVTTDKWVNQLMDLRAATAGDHSSRSILVADLPAVIRQSILAKAQDYWLNTGHQRAFQGLFQDSFWETAKLTVRTTPGTGRYDPNGQIIPGKEIKLLCVFGSSQDELGETSEVLSGVSVVDEEPMINEEAQQ